MRCKWFTCHIDKLFCIAVISTNKHLSINFF